MGGSDLVFTEFGSSRKTVKRTLIHFEAANFPIGSSTLVPVNEKQSSFLLTAPSEKLKFKTEKQNSVAAVGILKISGKVNCRNLVSSQTTIGGPNGEINGLDLLTFFSCEVQSRKSTPRL